MKKKSIHTKEDVKGLLYAIEYIMEEHFPTYTVLGDEEFKQIVSQLKEDYRRDVSKSTIARIFAFISKPHPLSYSKLDDFIYWCYRGKYDRFKDFLKEEKEKINNSIFINTEEILSVLDKEKNKVIIVSKDINIDLGNIPVSFNLGEGFVEKLISQVSIVTGDLLAKNIKTNPKDFGVFSDRRIQNRLYLKEFRRQINIERITAKALEQAKTKKSTTETVEPDWIIDFFDLAQDSSDKTMQLIWSKLLVNEIDKPGSISRRTLSTIKLINAKEAEIFTKLCNCVWTMEEVKFGREKILIKDMYENEEYSDESWKFNSLFIPHLEEIGLIFDSFIEMDSKRTYNLDFFGKEHQLKSKTKDQQLEIVVLSQVGEEIFQIINPKPNEEYYKVTMDYFKNRKILMQ